MAFYIGDALMEIKKIKPTADGHLDYATLPAFALKKVKQAIMGERELEVGGKVVKRMVPVDSVEVDARDIGAMVSMLTVAVQQLTDRIEKLEKK